MSAIARSSVLALAVVALTAAPAAAQAEAASDHHTVAITISPIHLLGPIVELTGEVAASSKIGVSGLVGVGEIDGISVFEVGAALRGYVVGDFDHGMQLGAEMLYVSVTVDEGDTIEGASGIAGKGSGFAVGPFIGYKITLDVGFTFEAQLGAQYFFATAEVDSGESASADGFAPLLNLNVGWAF